MLTLLAALVLPPFVMAEPAVEAPVAYEFAFAAEAGESRGEMQDRLQEEATRYCRDVMRAAGVEGEAGACARQIVAQVTVALDDAAYATFASND